jgi:hypothetical protein
MQVPKTLRFPCTQCLEQFANIVVIFCLNLIIEEFYGKLSYSRGYSVFIYEFLAYLNMGPIPAMVTVFWICDTTTTELGFLSGTSLRRIMSYVTFKWGFNVNNQN